ncbi:hypothetical protein J3E71DRAFT_388338 [Bipolaris maydis]|nr:hypothetical protein J3E71DRAFT_388338 [Bipolaris maydis]
MISPWRVSEAYTFFDANTKVGLDYDISARGDISSDNNIEFPLQHTALSMYEFRHPGIGHFRPWFNADVGVTGEIDLEGNFTISYQASTAGSISQGYPSAGLGNPYGYGVMSPKGDPFKGAIKSASSGGLKIRTTTQTGLEIVFNTYGNSGEFLGVNITGTTDTYTALQVENNKYTVSVGSDKASAGLIYASGGSEIISAWNPDSSTTVLLGDRLGAKQVASGSSGDDKDPSKGPNPHYIEYDGDATLAHFKNMLSCPAGSAPTCGLILCGTKNLDCSDDEDLPYTQYSGSEEKRGILSSEVSNSVYKEKEGVHSAGHSHAAFHHKDARAHLVPRSKKRKFEVPEPGNDKGKKRAIEYDDAPHVPAGGWDAYPGGDENYNNAYALADYDDCHDATIVSHIVPEKADVDENSLHFATEHIAEMNMIPTFLEQAAAGELPSGDTPALEAINGNFFIRHWRQRNYLPETVSDLAGGESSRTMAERVPITMGSKSNRGYFVLLERDLNSMKSRLWRFARFFDVDAFATDFNNNEANIMEAVTSFRYAEAVFNYLNVPRVNRNMIGVLNNLRSEFQLYQNQWNSDNPNETINLVGYWDVWIRDFFRHFREFTVGVAERSYLALQQLAPSGDDEFEAALVLIEDWIEELKGSSVALTGLD